MESWIHTLLTWALPSGFLGAVATWLVGRRKRDNDFLAEMQRSIDLLSHQYNRVLQENIGLQRERAVWLVLQEELSAKIDRLTQEVEQLRAQLNEAREAASERRGIGDTLKTKRNELHPLNTITNQAVPPVREPAADRLYHVAPDAASASSGDATTTTTCDDAAGGITGSRGADTSGELLAAI